MKLILGAGLSGLSASYHIGHEQCLILERSGQPFGHIASEQRDGFTWDQGPHVSFTKHEYVRQLFQESVDGALEEIEVCVGNYYKGYWIDQPAITALYQVPEPLRSACLESFLQSRNKIEASVPDNYCEWLNQAFGSVFSETFASVYTQKYWTRAPAELNTDWVGGRVHAPRINEVRQGAVGPLDRSLHYITNVRYPKVGGYQSFASLLKAGSNIQYGADVVEIDLSQQELTLADGRRFVYEQLINTLPLPTFIRACRQVPRNVLEAAEQLHCTQLVLVNVAVPHQALRSEHWLYVYDKEKLSTRINFVEKLSKSNAPRNWSGIQTEVYFSRYQPMNISPEDIGKQVESELINMGLIDPSRFSKGQSTHCHVKYIPWANVAFDHGTSLALQEIWEWLEGFGLIREDGDTHPLTDWTTQKFAPLDQSQILMAGRFGQWKYYWSDDCVLRGKRISTMLGGGNDLS